MFNLVLPFIDYLMTYHKLLDAFDSYDQKWDEEWLTVDDLPFDFDDENELHALAN